MSRAIIEEVHVDSQEAFPVEFERFLSAHGFHNDPFTVPTEGEPAFATHWTRRKVLPEQHLQQRPHFLRTFVLLIVEEAQRHSLNLYAEAEIVYPDNSFRVGRDPIPPATQSLETGLGQWQCSPTGVFGGAAADIHVEFAADAIDDATRASFLAHQFYPVTGIDPHDGVAYVVFTIQTKTYGQGLRLYRELLTTVGNLPGFRELTLEQKLGMQQTGSCQMPEVIDVVLR